MATAMDLYPTIAGCVGVWDASMTLRKGKTSKACGDDGERLSPADRTNLLYIITPVAAANNSIFMILSGVNPEGTIIVEFPEKGTPRVIYDYADKYAASNVCVLDKDMSPLRSIYQMRVAGDGVFTMRESGNVPKHEGEERITLVLSGDTCSISTETIIPNRIL